MAKEMIDFQIYANCLLIRDVLVNLYGNMLNINDLTHACPGCNNNCINANRIGNSAVSQMSKADE